MKAQMFLAELLCTQGINYSAERDPGGAMFRLFDFYLLLFTLPPLNVMNI